MFATKVTEAANSRRAQPARASQAPKALNFRQLASSTNPNNAGDDREEYSAKRRKIADEENGELEHDTNDDNGPDTLVELPFCKLRVPNHTLTMTTEDVTKCVGSREFVSVGSMRDFFLRFHTSSIAAELQMNIAEMSQQSDRVSAEWVTMGVVVGQYGPIKLTDKSSKSGDASKSDIHLLVWTVHDLMHTQVDVFMLGAETRLRECAAQVTQCAVVAVLNPRFVRPLHAPYVYPQQQPERIVTYKPPIFMLEIDVATQLCVLGRSTDVGLCNAHIEDKGKCANIINTRTSSACYAHLLLKIAEQGSHRMEFNDPHMLAPSRVQQQENERQSFMNLSEGIYSLRRHSIGITKRGGVSVDKKPTGPAGSSSRMSIEDALAKVINTPRTKYAAGVHNLQKLNGQGQVLTAEDKLKIFKRKNKDVKDTMSIASISLVSSSASSPKVILHPNSRALNQVPVRKKKQQSDYNDDESIELDVSSGDEGGDWDDSAPRDSAPASEEHKASQPEGPIGFSCLEVW
jgi:hypothetical protein